MPPSLRGALAIGLAWGVFGAVHSLLAREWVKRAAERLHGPALLAGFYRPLYAVVSTALLVWLWTFPRDLPADVLIAALPGEWSLLPFLVKAAAAGLAVGAFWQINFREFIGMGQLLRWWRGEYEDLLPTPPGDLPLAQAQEPLACRGVYLWVRHPLNTATFLWIWAQPTYSLYNVVFAACLTAYILIGNRLEERDLLRRYGAAYARYREVVPSFFSGFRGLRLRAEALKQAMPGEEAGG